MSFIMGQYMGLGITEEQRAAARAAAEYKARVKAAGSQVQTLVTRAGGDAAAALAQYNQMVAAGTDYLQARNEVLAKFAPNVAPPDSGAGMPKWVPVAAAAAVGVGFLAWLAGRKKSS